MPSAIDVPALVDTHFQCLDTVRYYEYSIGFMRSAYRSSLALSESEGQPTRSSVFDFLYGHEDLEIGQRWCRREQNLLKVVQLFHVSESMVHVAAAASETIPPTTTLQIEDFPSLTGFMVFEKPMTSVDIFGRETSFRAVSWEWETKEELSRSIAKSTDQDMKQFDGVYGWSLVFYKDAPRDAGLGPFQVAHFQFAFIGERIGHDSVAHPDVAKREDMEPWLTEEFVFQSTNLTRYIYAIFQLMTQTIANVNEHEDTRLARRVRQGKAKTPPMVTVVTLRRESDYGERDSDGTWLSYRYVRRGHWRRQPYGPGRAEHRTIWISPTMVGSPDLPFHQPRHVTSLAR